MGAAEEVAAVRTLLARVARRLWFWRLLKRFLRVSAGCSAAIGLVVLGHRLGFGPDQRGVPLLALSGLALVLAMIPGLRPVRIGRAAAAVDAAYALGERFTTAWEVIGQPGTASRLVVRGAARSGATVDVRRVPRVGVIRDGWLAATSAALAFVLWLLPTGPSGAHQPTDRAMTPADALTARHGSAADAPRSPGAAAPARRLREALGLRPGNPPLPSSSGALKEGSSGSGAAAPSSSDALERSVPVVAPGRGDGADRRPRPEDQPGQHARTGSTGAGREGASAEGRVGEPGVGSDGSQATSTGGTTGGGGVGPSLMTKTPPRAVQGSQPPPTSLPSTEQDVRAAPGAASMSPGLRQYILRYFDQLRRTRDAGGSRDTG